MSITIRTNSTEPELIKKFANFYGMTVSEFIKTTVFQHIEDEYDIKCAEEALKEYEEDPTTYTLDEVSEHLGIKDNDNV